MITIEGPESYETPEPEESAATDLASVNSGQLAKKEQPAATLSAGMLEQALLKRFPAEDAEDWDRTGLLVGDPTAQVTGVCVALDPTEKAIRAASALGANVLLTHHPAYLQPPESITPSRERSATAGANVWRAATAGVALMNFHTALDVSTDARELFMRLLKMEYERMLVPSGANPEKGYGYLCHVRAQDAPFKLSHLAARCTSVFGRAPRVWGSLADQVSTVVFANGSAGNVVDAAVAARADCLVCGEVRYHAALDASQAGLSIVELGHDASELPLVALLARAAVQAGVAPEDVHVLDQSGNWVLPDSTRLYNSAVE